MTILGPQGFHRLWLIVGLLAGCVLIGTGQEAPTWKLHKSEKGIRVYTRPQEGSSFKAVRAETSLPASLSSALALLWDIDRYPEWVPHTSFTRVLDQEDHRSITYYLQVSAPWPANDRDGIYHIELRRESDRQVSLRFECVPDRLPEKEDYVRIPSCRGSWILKALPTDELAVEYEMFSTMGGNLPGWMANLGATAAPFKMMEEIRERVRQAPYRQATFELPPEE